MFKLNSEKPFVKDFIDSIVEQSNLESAKFSNKIVKIND
jgi:hypothetical protein